MKVNITTGFITVLMSTTSAIASASPSIGQSFEVIGQISKYYGGCKSAEAAMWSQALKFCDQIESGLILNRESEVICETSKASVVSAKANFVCVAAGNGN